MTGNADIEYRRYEMRAVIKYLTPFPSCNNISIMKIRRNFIQTIIICFFISLALCSCGKKTSGDFTPTRFEWSGGSGRVNISCEKVTVTDEGAVAELTFSSPSYDYVRLEDEKIYGDHTEKTSTFLVPVELDKDMELIGCTSAMSKPHEISYTIFVSIDDRYSAGESGQGTAGTESGAADVKKKETQSGVGDSSEAYSDGDSSDNDLSSSKKVYNESSNPREMVKDLQTSGNEETELAPKALAGLVLDHSMELSYARCFAVHYYSGVGDHATVNKDYSRIDGPEEISHQDSDRVHENRNSLYKLISVLDGRKYLLVPEGLSVPENLPEGIIVLDKPIQSVYLAATSAMSLFNVLDGLSLIKYTGTDISGWDIEAPREALKSGRMTFAGKYSAPDYEMLLDGGCDIAIESTMILHSPETKEQLEKIGIPVFIDWSSYETDVLGRTEWVKLYGALTDHEAEAEAFFQRELLCSGIPEGFEKKDKTVAFFYFNSRGLAVIRSATDYIPKMIRDGGGEYIFDSLKINGNGITRDISMEEFYGAAADADYIIYNGSIDSSVETIADLVAMNELLSSFKAVKEDHVYVVDKKFYQSTDTVSEFARDVHLMLSGDNDDMTFLKKLK